MRYVGRRASETAPLRSLPLYRSVESVFGASPKAKAEAELRIAKGHLEAELAAYADACADLGSANRRPVMWPHGQKGLRAYYQAQALRTINGRRKFLRAAQRRVAAAELAIAALTPADTYATPYLAQLAGIAA